MNFLTHALTLRSASGQVLLEATGQLEQIISIAGLLTLQPRAELTAAVYNIRLNQQQDFTCISGGTITITRFAETVAELSTLGALAVQSPLEGAAES